MLLYKLYILKKKNGSLACGLKFKNACTSAAENGFKREALGGLKAAARPP